MKITGDQMLVKKINKSIVLDTIRRHAPSLVRECLR